jgi:hypothetical protein
MYWIFNKQYRTEEKIIGTLIKNIKKSKLFVNYAEGNDEVYELDNMNVRFTIVNKNIIVVTDKSGNEIISMDCTYDNDEVQSVRANWFHGVIEIARKRQDKEKEKQEKAKKLQEAKKAAEAAMKIKEEQQAKENAMLAALYRMKDLSK